MGCLEEAGLGCFGMSSAGRRMERGGRTAPPRGAAVVWLTFQWPLSLFRSESLLVLLVTPWPRPHVSESGWFPPVAMREHGIVQFSCALEGSASPWSNGSASSLHFLAGLSWAVSVSVVGSVEPFWSGLGAACWLHPLEFLSSTGVGGASSAG